MKKSIIIHYTDGKVEAFSGESIRVRFSGNYLYILSDFKELAQIDYRDIFDIQF